MLLLPAETTTSELSRRLAAFSTQGSFFLNSLVFATFAGLRCLRFRGSSDSDSEVEPALAGAPEHASERLAMQLHRFRAEDGAVLNPGDLSLPRETRAANGERN